MLLVWCEACCEATETVGYSTTLVLSSAWPVEALQVHLVDSSSVPCVEASVVYRCGFQAKLK